MRSASIVALTFAAVVFGAPVDSGISLVERQSALNGGVFFCTAPNFTGVCARTPPITDECHNLDTNWYKQINSFRAEPEGSVVCLLWSDLNCAGANPGGWIADPVGELSAINFNNTTGSYQCKNP